MTNSDLKILLPLKYINILQSHIFCNVYPNKFHTNTNYNTFKFNLTNRLK